MKKRTAIFFFAAVLCAGQLSSQVSMGNIVKYNLTPTAFGIYTLAYERVINPKQSVGISFSLAPNLGLPFKDFLLEKYGDNPEAVTAINSTTFNNFSITPSWRFYTAGLSPVGFYLESFIRYSHMVHEGEYYFTASNGNVHTPFITTTFNAVGVGEMIGIQWAFGANKNIVLDWWIVGPYFGIINGNSHGTDDMSDMTQEDKEKLESDIENVGIPGWQIEATVGEGEVDADLSGAYYGARLMGLCIGFRF